MSKVFYICWDDHMVFSFNQLMINPLNRLAHFNHFASLRWIIFGNDMYLIGFSGFMWLTFYSGLLHLSLKVRLDWILILSLSDFAIRITLLHRMRWAVFPHFTFTGTICLRKQWSVLWSLGLNGKIFWA